MSLDAIIQVDYLCADCNHSIDDHDLEEGGCDLRCEGCECPGYEESDE